MKRHLARMANTDQRIVVVFMQIPQREDHALVIATDNLPPRWEQYLMQVVESPEGQGDPDLGNVLGRRLMPDSTETLLQAFHNAGLLRAVPVANVIMFPEPNRPYALKQILQAMGRVMPDEYQAVDALKESVQHQHQHQQQPLRQAPRPTTANDLFGAHEPQKFNPHTSNQTAAVTEQHVGIANGLLMEADMLEADARAKREKAYSFAPHLRPAPTRPQPVQPLSMAKPAPKRRAAQKVVEAPVVVEPVKAAPKRRTAAVKTKASK